MYVSINSSPVMIVARNDNYFFKDLVALPKTDLSRLLGQQRLESIEKKRL